MLQISIGVIKLKNNPKLSIIVPVYNVEQYLKRCLDSILNSTFQDFELIIINDGSTDKSEKIILEFINDYKDKIIYLPQENAGVSVARNVGIKAATGKYIAFVDCDDYIESNMFELMVAKMEQDNFDIVSCDAKMVYEGSKDSKIVSSGYTQDLYHKNRIRETMPTFYPVMWNKIYKTELVKKFEFTSGVWYEDMEYLLKLYPHINSIGVVKQPLYNYLQRKNSITYTYNDKLYDIINNMERVIECYKLERVYEEYKSELEYLYVRYAFITFPKRLAKCKDKIKYNKGIEFAFRKVNEYFPDYKKNRYLKLMGIKGKYIKQFNRFLAYLNYMVQNGKKYN